MIKLGVIGCGGIGRYHIENFQKAGAEVMAIADKDKETVERMANQFKIKNKFTDYKKLLVLKEIKAISVATPNFLHHEITLNALKSGKHVLCEKPMAMNSGEAEEMRTMARKEKLIFMLGLSHRFRADTKVAKDYMAKGELGHIYHSQAVLIRRRGIPGLGGWFTTKALSSGGVMADIGCHSIDLSLYLMGYPEPLSCTAATYTKFGDKKNYVSLGMWGKPVPGGKFDVDDFAAAFIRFKNGATLALECSWAANSDDYFYNQIFGDKGGLRLEWGKPLVFYGEKDRRLIDLFPKYGDSDSYYEEFKHFVECVNENKKPIPSADEGVVLQKIMDAIYTSAQEKKEVAI